jgi:RNA polymerase sigma-70 factor, ECF subfamily
VTLPIAATALPPLPLHVESGDLASLIARTSAGDADALAALFRRYGESVHAVALRLSRSPDEADDILQDIFIGLPEALRRYEERGQFEAWLARVTARVTLMRMRGSRRSVALPPDADMPHGASPSDHLDARITLQRALEELSPAARAIVVRREVEGRTHAEIARELGISRNNSEVRLFRALRQLRSFLRDSR